MAKECPRCGSNIEGRKKYCNNSCKYWFNSIRKEKEKHLPPVKKRNSNYCYVYVSVGNTASQRGQGSRSGGMIKGGMSANVSFEVCELRPFNLESIQHHFTSKMNYPYIPRIIVLGDGTRLTKDEAIAAINLHPIP